MVINVDGYGVGGDDCNGDEVRTDFGSDNGDDVDCFGCSVGANGDGDHFTYLFRLATLIGRAQIMMIIMMVLRMITMTAWRPVTVAGS